jgi:hypothetical protein
MTKVLQLRDVRDTKLWKVLSTDFKDNDSIVATALAQNVIQICEELSQRIKGFYSLHPQFTLHDETHFLRVTELMSRIIPDETLKQLNPIEVALLIFVAYFHDQGMVLTVKEIEGLDENTDFQVFKANWIENNPNYSEIVESSRTTVGIEYDRCIQRLNELRSLMLSEYIRITHGKRAADFIKSEYALDKRIEACEVNLSDLIANLCWSHVRPANDVIPANGYYLDESIGNYTVNMQYIAVILRLADILDFDRERTPQALYRTIHFTSDVSVKEWAKHLSVGGWVISKDLIRFTLKCEHPVYQKTALQFMDWIDDELISAYGLINQFSNVIAAKYKLALPIRVDRSRIEPQDNSYSYYDLEFSLSRDAVVRLLMTDRLYTSPSLCIRELLQNALDALRHRQAIMKRDNGTHFHNGQIEIEHSVNSEGYEVLRCTDNGIGMNEPIIRKFLTRAGTSYYRSSEFLQERNTFLKAGVDFDPCGQFGIGFMSCFMFGDRIKILTRRDRGPNSGYDSPIVVEINGLGGIVVVRKGAPDQPVGTTVEITGGKKPKFLDESEDILRLVEYVSTVCVGADYPINVKCSIPEIENSFTITPFSAKPITNMESAGLSCIKTFHQSFNEIHPQLTGEMKVSFLIDDDQKLTLANSEAYWVNTNPDVMDSIKLVDARDDKYFKTYAINDGISLDGILVCGRPTSIKIRLDDIGIEDNVLTDIFESYMIDVRGNIKPELSPARTFPSRIGEDWDRIASFIMLGHGKIWGKVLQTETDYEMIWQIAIINGASFPWINSYSIWKYVQVPLIDEFGVIEWSKISELMRVNLVSENNDVKFVTNFNKEISSYEKLERWDSERYRRKSVEQEIKKTLISMGTISIENDQVFLELREPTTPDKAPFEFLFKEHPMIYALPFSTMINHLFSIEIPIKIVNRKHALVQLALKQKYSKDVSDIELFSDWASFVLSSPSLIAESILTGAVASKDMRTLGRLSESMDWSQIPPEFHPPYLIWTRANGVISISMETLRQWAYAEVY